MSLGVPKEKLIIGMPTYARGFTLEDPNNYMLGAAVSGASKAGPYTKEKGFVAYYEV